MKEEYAQPPHKNYAKHCYWSLDEKILFNVAIESDS